ncbi:hypothetical protein A3Q56_00344 [Intoshia linei]|uniref:Rho-GAP domain-containing protein n=1 Tax=Intoshia linei TaxID=1819745 RepID=A0A177BCB5_9BILA|nr:hypothetical protein A3Q56_00344 [Intoshia linei]
MNKNQTRIPRGQFYNIVRNIETRYTEKLNNNLMCNELFKDLAKVHGNNSKILKKIHDKFKMKIKDCSVKKDSEIHKMLEIVNRNKTNEMEIFNHYTNRMIPLSSNCVNMCNQIIKHTKSAYIEINNYVFKYGDKIMQNMKEFTSNQKKVAKFLTYNEKKKKKNEKMFYQSMNFINLQQSDIATFADLIKYVRCDVYPETLKLFEFGLRDREDQLLLYEMSMYKTLSEEYQEYSNNINSYIMQPFKDGIDLIVNEDDTDYGSLRGNQMIFYDTHEGIYENNIKEAVHYKDEVQIIESDLKELKIKIDAALDAISEQNKLIYEYDYRNATSQSQSSNKGTYSTSLILSVCNFEWGIGDETSKIINDYILMRINFKKSCIKEYIFSQLIVANHKEYASYVIKNIEENMKSFHDQNHNKEILVCDRLLESPYKCDLDIYNTIFKVDIPQFVIICCDFIAKNTNAVGIFRHSGSIYETNAFIKSIVAKKNVDVFLISKNIHNVTSALKKFIKSLHTTLLPQNFISQITILNNNINNVKNSAKIQHILKEQLIEALAKLRNAEYVTQRYFFGCLNFIHQNSHKNKMDAANLSLIIPFTISPTTDTSEFGILQIIIEQLIINYDTIYDTSFGTVFSKPKRVVSASEYDEKLIIQENEVELMEDEVPPQSPLEIASDCHILSGNVTDEVELVDDPELIDMLNMPDKENDQLEKYLEENTNENDYQNEYDDSHNDNQDEPNEQDYEYPEERHSQHEVGYEEQYEINVESEEITHSSSIPLSPISDQELNVETSFDDISYDENSQVPTTLIRKPSNLIFTDQPNSNKYHENIRKMSVKIAKEFNAKSENNSSSFERADFIDNSNNEVEVFDINDRQSNINADQHFQDATQHSDTIPEDQHNEK